MLILSLTQRVRWCAHRPAPVALAVCLLTATLPTLSRAAEAAVSAEAGNASFDVGRVVITGARLGPLAARSVLTSVDVLNADVIREQTTQATWELFGQVPGTLLTNFNQGTTSGKVSMRGFNGEGEVNAVKLLIDGVPSNSNDGNMPFLDAVFPLELQAIELVRGTNDARFGLHNVAGSINLVTRSRETGTRARVALGAFNSTDLQAALGLASGPPEGVWQQQYFVGHKRSDGWRDHAESKKTTLSGQWFYNTPTWQAGVVLRHFEHDAQEPGYLTLADARDNPTQSYAFVATDGGERSTTQLALHLDAHPADALDTSLRIYLNRFADSRWVKFSANVSQQERVTDETQVGARASVSWRPKVAGLQAFALEGGLDIESQDNESARYNTTERVRVRQTRDQRWTLDNIGGYVQAVLQPVAGLQLVPGWRVDQFDGEFQNPLTGTRADINGYGTVHSPKFSVVWSPVDGASVYGNLGRTFQIGVGAASYKIPPRTADLTPSINDGWELGLKFNPLPLLDGRLAAWQQTASNEVRRKLNDPSGDSENIGATRRRGLDVQLALHATPQLEAWMALTRQQTEITTPDPAAPATAGKEIDHVPHQVYNAGIDWTPLRGWKFSAWAQGQGDYYLERSNSTGRFGGYDQLNLGATWQATPAIRLEAQLRNATDRRSEYVWYDGTQSLHSPGAPRAWSLAVSTAL